MDYLFSVCQRDKLAVKEVHVCHVDGIGRELGVSLHGTNSISVPSYMTILSNIQCLRKNSTLGKKDEI